MRRVRGGVLADRKVAEPREDEAVARPEQRAEERIQLIKDLAMFFEQAGGLFVRLLPLSTAGIGARALAKAPR